MKTVIKHRHQARKEAYKCPSTVRVKTETFGTAAWKTNSV